MHVVCHVVGWVMGGLKGLSFAAAHQLRMLFDTKRLLLVRPDAGRAHGVAQVRGATPWPKGGVSQR